jgi:hypothetical protein
MMLARRALLIRIVNFTLFLSLVNDYGQFIGAKPLFSALCSGAVFIPALTVALNRLAGNFIKNSRQSLGPFCSLRIIKDYKGLKNFGMIGNL